MNGPIVVDIYGSDTASRALTAGHDLAKIYDQPLYVVCGYPMEQTRECGPMTERRVPMTTRPWVCEVLAAAETRARNAGVRVSVHGGFGRGSDAIIAVAEAVGVALIVIGDRESGPRLGSSSATFPTPSSIMRRARYTSCERPDRRH